MSEIRVNTIKSEDGASPISFNKGVNVTGVATATSFVGDLTGDVTGDLTGTATNASGLTGSPNITVTNITGVAATFSGVLTYDDVTNVDSIGLVTARSGLEVTGIITARPGTAVTFKGGVEIKDASETVSTGSTTAFTTTLVTLECDVRNGTVFTHDIANGAVGIVSITNFPAVKNSFHTVSVIFTQGSTNAALGNTEAVSGIGTNITLKPQGVSGISTVARVGSGTTFVGLSTTPSDIDIVTFGIHYNGSTNTEANNYKTFATKNGEFRFA
jgi:hypothetical protein